MSGDNNDDSQLPENRYGPADTVFVGETPVSLQLVRSIYQELTGKPESISRSYTDPIQITLNDIEQLNHKFIQACKQYAIVAATCSFTIFFVNNTKEVFASFDEFARHNAGQSSPVESLLIKYNFMIVPPNEQKPQAYSMSVRMVSRLAVERRMRGEFLFDAPPRILRMMGNRTAVVEIEYIDYMVARTILGIIDDWCIVLPKALEKKWIDFAQRQSYLIPRLARFFTVVITSLIVIHMIPSFISESEPSLLKFGELLLYAVVGTYTACGLAWWFGRMLERAIDSWSYLSYIKLNKGDEAEIAQAIEQNRKNLIKGAVGFICMMMVNVVAEITAIVVIHYFHLVP